LAVVSTLPALLALACAGSGATAPWPRPEAPRRLAHAEVSTLNPDYQRQKSAVLVRKIDRPPGPTWTSPPTTPTS
jgi:hypothetical protein